MTLPIPDHFPLQPVAPVHVPGPDEREPRTRRKLLFWDRTKLLVILAVVFGFGIAVRHQDVPIMSWGDAFREQLDAKWWIFLLAGLELVHQIHMFIAERSAGYHQLWERKVWGAWEARMSKLNPWLRYRLGRMVRIFSWGTLAMVIFAGLWNVSFLEAIAQAPGRLWNNPFGNGGMPWFFNFIFAMLFGVMQFVAIFWFMSKGGVETYMPQEIKTRFADVWGQDRVLDKVKENIVFLERPEEIESKGGHVPSGILLWGPPGTGKTLMAEAVAGETGRPYVFVDPGAFQNMFMGVGILKVKSLFRKLRKLALRHGGVIVFFDEADVLGNRGGAVARTPSTEAQRMLAHAMGCNGHHYLSQHSASMLVADQLAGLAPEPQQAISRFATVSNIVMSGLNGGGGGMGTLQALLTELSGLKKPRGIVSRRLRAFLSMKPKQPPKYRILVMMATNMPDSLDAALLRPGRLDRQYKVDYPNLEGRIKTFEGYFDKVKHCLTAEHIERLATMSPHGTGATIKDIVNESVIVAIRDGRDMVTWPDVLEAKAFKIHGLADGPAAMELEQLETALHEAGHAVAGYLLRRRLVIDIATIEQRGDVGGFVSSVPVEERKFHWRSEMENDVVVSLASLATERIFFEEDNSGGVGGDMGAATSMVRTMLSRWAMGDTLTSHVTNPATQGLGSTNDDLSDARRDEFDRRVETRLQEVYKRTYDLMYENRWFLAAIAHALQAHKTITGEDIDAIYRGAQGPTLDGMMYRTEAFVQQYGAYLAAAQEAHKSQGRIAVPLPRFEPVPSYGAPVVDLRYGQPNGYGHGYVPPAAVPPAVPGVPVGGA